VDADVIADVQRKNAPAVQNANAVAINNLQKNRTLKKFCFLILLLIEKFRAYLREWWNKAIFWPCYIVYNKKTAETMLSLSGYEFLFLIIKLT